MISRSQKAGRIFVVSPCRCDARFLAEHCGIPYEIGLPGAFLNDLAAKIASGLAKEDRVLIIHQQVLAGGTRGASGGHHGLITCATFFEQPAGIYLAMLSFARKTSSRRLWQAAVLRQLSAIRRSAALPSFGGRFLALPHFAVSGTTSAS